MFINIALPKGRLGEKSYELLKKLGYSCKEFEEESRKLIFENKESKVRFYLVKTADVPVYVERGAADIGIVGKDVLMESQCDVLEMIDLNYGKCRFAVAAPKGYVDDYDKTLIVATKYINVAREHFAKKERPIELIKLNGSVELGPLVDLSDVIVDIVETGNTLKENNLIVLEEFGSSSARLIVNRANFRFKNERLEELLEKVKGEIE